MLLLGNSLLQQKSTSLEKANLKLRLQELCNTNLSDDNIDSLIQQNFAKIECYADLLLFVQTSKAFFVIIFGETAVFALQITSLEQHVVDERILYECMFKVDLLFGIKFAYAIDRISQTFLTKCMDRSSIGVIDPSFYDMSFLTSGVQHQRFSGILPPCLVQTSTITSVIASKQKDATKGDHKEGKGKPKEDRFVVNENRRLEWIIPESVRVGDVFPADAMKEVPDFKTGVKCCVHFHSKGWCFKNCGLAESHADLSKTVGETYHTWQAKHRKA